MGLDMHLMGTLDGKVDINSSKDIELAYWRKHPNLHGYIVDTFADGIDKCQPIELDKDKLKKIIFAIFDCQLPHTTGFFFGTSENSDEQIKQDIYQLSKAITWLRNCPNAKIYYHASW